MKKLLALTVSTIIIAGSVATAVAASGQELFTKHCAVCHPSGGNIIKPQHTLQKASLAKEGIKDWKGIVKYMRKPGAGMTKFDLNTIPDKEAKEIAEYILKTFK